MAIITFQKLLQVLEYVLKILLKAVDVLQGDNDSESD